VLTQKFIKALTIFSIEVWSCFSHNYKPYTPLFSLCITDKKGVQVLVPKNKFYLPISSFQSEGFLSMKSFISFLHLLLLW